MFSTPLFTPRLVMRFPQQGDETILQALEERNQSYWAPWESTSLDPLKKTYQERLEMWKKECEENQAARFLLFKKESLDHLIGLCNFTQIVYGPFQACYLGYKIDREYEGQGLMFEALQRAIQSIFEDLHLHRIMANYMPTNLRSAKLLERLGFVIEGYAKDYLFINHRWEDHVLTALTDERWKSVKIK